MPLSRNFLRSLVTVSTFTLANSTRMAALPRENLSFSSLMIASFSLLSTRFHLLQYAPASLDELGAGAMCLVPENRGREREGTKTHRFPCLGRAGLVAV